MAVDNIARGMAAKALENQGGGGSSLPIVNTATVGQTIRVAAVDENGQPTEWEAVDPASGGGETWENIRSITLSEDTNTVNISTDEQGKSYSLKKVRITLYGKAFDSVDFFINGARAIRSAVLDTNISAGGLSAEPHGGRLLVEAYSRSAANYIASNVYCNLFSQSESLITSLSLVVTNGNTIASGSTITVEGVRA